MVALFHHSECVGTKVSSITEEHPSPNWHIMLHVDIYKSHVNIIILHGDIIFHACKGRAEVCHHTMCHVCFLTNNRGNEQKDHHFLHLLVVEKKK